MTTKRRTYTRRDKVTAIIAADMTSMTAAAEATGVPLSTLDYWMDRPEFAELRKNARERMAEEALTVARLAWGHLAKAIAAGDLDGRDLVMAAGMATDKAQLLNGLATSRTESRDLTGTLDDAELAAAVREAEALLRGTPVKAPDEAAG